MNVGIIRWIISGCVFLLGLALVQNAHSALLTDPNLTASDPNTPALDSTFFRPDPNTSSTSDSSIPGTLALNWLYQGKKPLTPLVGQENISFHTAVYPWPYFGYDYDRPWPGRWLHHPSSRYNYGPWAGYGHRWWYRDDFTYPLNYAEVRMNLDAQTSFHLGAFFLSDPLDDDFRSNGP